MVIDIKKGEECCDMQYVTYFQGKPYDGTFTYTNLTYINEALKQYRQGNLEGLVNEGS